MNVQTAAVVFLLGCCVGVYASTGHDDHAETTVNGLVYPWRLATIYNLTAGLEYEWKLQYRACTTESMQFMLINAENNAGHAGVTHAQEFATKYWYNERNLHTGADWPFTPEGVNPLRYTFRQDDSLGEQTLNSNDTLGSLADGSRKVFAGCTAQNQGCTSFSIFTVKFNTSKAEACVAVATTTTTTTDSHAGHGHRRSDAHDHSGTQMVMAITVPTTGSYVIFADQNWPVDYEGNLYQGANVVAYADQDSNNLVTYCVAAAAATTSSSCNCNDRKWGYFAGIFVIGLAGLIPIFMRQTFGDARSWIVQLGNMFAAGILLAVAVQHIIPEVMELYPPSKTDGYKLAMAMVLIGYVFMLAIEILFSKLADCVRGEPVQKTTDSFFVEKVADVPMACQDNGRACCTVEGSGTGHGAHGSDFEVDTDHTETQGIAEAVVLVAGLSVHGWFEGMLLGFATTTTTADTLFAGIIAHKAFASFALGGVLIRVMPRYTWLCILMLVIFAGTTPAGIGAGIALDNNSEATNEANGLVSAFAAGIIIYVALAELALPTMALMGTSWLSNQEMKALFFTLGVLCILLVAINDTNDGAAHNH